ncbi:YcbK family protein [Dysosmobacter sp.]|uniref:YcbK family protein n=1 Tax=Dysosmobacter sp. TaxID=2591382 RepID=UPI002A9B7B2F|nr:D-Ala-D-Ala carboxypeptidase family metallohydrolase [Dysosmobacter sp.]MDY5510270.1 D-Ala-D-Ala carboxypeptidase family metallohydrolase [Dysosmobacter sp.]
MGVKSYSVKTDGSKYLSANFKVSEFKCNDGSDVVKISDELVSLLQKIRDHFGKAVVINSGYRTAAYNKKVGGASKSQHVQGTAADIVISGVSPLEVAQYAEYLQPKSGGIGVYTTFTHVDVRTTRSRWDSRSGKEVVVSGWPGYSEETELDKAVAWITSAGIMQGNSDGDLMLDQPLTRKQYVLLEYRKHLAGLK